MGLRPRLFFIPISVQRAARGGPIVVVKRVGDFRDDGSQFEVLNVIARHARKIGCRGAMIITAMGDWHALLARRVGFVLGQMDGALVFGHNFFGRIENGFQHQPAWDTLGVATDGNEGQSQHFFFGVEIQNQHFRYRVYLVSPALLFEFIFFLGTFRYRRGRHGFIAHGKGQCVANVFIFLVLKQAVAERLCRFQER